MRTLAIAASVVLGVLVLGIAALSLFPDPNATDPVVILTIAPAGTPASGADSAPASGQPAEGAAAPQGKRRRPARLTRPFLQARRRKPSLPQQHPMAAARPSPPPRKPRLR